MSDVDMSTGAVSELRDGGPAPSLQPEGPAPSPDLGPAGDYVRLVAGFLGLSGWDLTIGFDGAMSDASARVEAPAYQRRATILFGPVFLTESPHERRDTVVHELLHLVLMDSWKFVDELLEQEMSQRVARVAWLGYVSHVESHIDHLARLLAPTAPLPPEPAV